MVEKEIEESGRDADGICHEYGFEVMLEDYSNDSVWLCPTYTAYLAIEPEIVLEIQ